MANYFICCDCKKVKLIQSSGGTGYARTQWKSEPICYDCCGERDKGFMRERERMSLYLTQNEDKSWSVGNWPGTLKFRAKVQVGKHNIARVRYDTWFTDADGRDWWGVCYGDHTQIVHCRKLKRKQILRAPRDWHT